MLLFVVGIALAAGSLLAAQKFGLRRALPFVALVSVALLGLSDYLLGIAPLVGLAASYQLDRSQTYGWVIAGAALPGALLALQLMAIMPATLPGELVDEQLRLQREQMASFGLPVNEELSELQEQAVRVGYALLPSVVFFFALLQAVLAYRVGHAAAGLADVVLPPPAPLRGWRPWSLLIWVLVGGLALSLTGGAWVGDLGRNLVVVMTVIYAGQGVAVVRHLAHRLGVGVMLEIAFYGVLALSFVGLLLLPLVGLLDTWFDWRRLDVDGEDKNGDPRLDD